MTPFSSTASTQPVHHNICTDVKNLVNKCYSDKKSRDLLSCIAKYVEVMQHSKSSIRLPAEKSTHSVLCLLPCQSTKRQRSPCFKRATHHEGIDKPMPCRQTRKSTQFNRNVCGQCFVRVRATEHDQQAPNQRDQTLSLNQSPEGGIKFSSSVSSARSLGGVRGGERGGDGVGDGVGE